MNIEEIAKYRSETPGTQHVIHFNNAGAALTPTPVYQAVQEYLESEYLIGGYETCEKYAEGFASTKKAIAQLLSASSDEIALLESATTAWYKAFLGLNLQKGDIILTSVTEYVSNFLGFLREKESKGIEIQVIPQVATGEIDVEALGKMITPRVKLIAITHIPTNGGLVNPAKEVGELARKHQTPYLLDACQTVGQMPIDVDEIGCDMLSATGRKFLRGPRGTGFLYVRKSLIPQMHPPLPDLVSNTWEDPYTSIPRDGAIRFENYEKHFAGQIGLGVATQYALDIGLDRIWERVLMLSGMLRESLNKLDGIQTRDLGIQPCGIVTFTSEKLDAQEIKTRLLQRNINVSLVMPEGALLDMRDRKLGNMIRASVHYYNTEEEIETFTEILGSL